MAVRAIEEFGNAQVGLPEGPPFFKFSDTAESRRALEGAGFGHVDVRLLPLTWRLQSADAVFAAVSQGGVRTAAVLQAQTPEALDRIRTAIRRGVERYARDGEFLIPMPAALASATKR